MTQVDGTNIGKVLNPYNLHDLREDVEVSLDTLDIYKDANERYFRLIYKCKTKNGDKYIVEFPKVEIPIPTNHLPEVVTATRYIDPELGIKCQDVLNVDYGHTIAMPVSQYTKMVSYQLTNPVKEMTVAEIEKILGYKIKVISEENKN